MGSLHSTAETSFTNTDTLSNNLTPHRAKFHILYTVDTEQILLKFRMRGRCKWYPKEPFTLWGASCFVVLFSILSVKSKSLALKHYCFYSNIASEKAQNEMCIVLPELIKWLKARLRPFSHFCGKQKHNKEKRNPELGIMRLCTGPNFDLTFCTPGTTGKVLMRSPGTRGKNT